MSSLFGGGNQNADQSGMVQALISAQAADKAYALGTQQLDWAKQQWAQEQPMIQQIVTSDIGAQDQATAFAKEQENLYKSTYEPLEQSYAQQAQQWASPGQQQLNAAAASANVNEAAESQRTAAQEQLESFGINPGSTRYAGLDIGSRTMQAAAAAGAGTQAIQATKLQGLGLEAGVVNTGRGLPNTVAGLASTGVGAGSAAAGGLQSNLSTGSNAMTSPSNWFNTGASNMNTYVNSVNGFNQTQLGYTQAGAMQSMGMGSLIGGLLEDGGIVGEYDNGGPAIPPAGAGGAVSPTPGVMASAHAIPPPRNGGAVPTASSPSAGKEADDVPARLTVHEFVIPKDVALWEGQKKMYSMIDSARKAKAEAMARNDIGGESGYAQPAIPTFVSRSSDTGQMRPAIPSQHARAV